MFDLQVLALQGDVTRVITFQLARETSNRTYTEIGVSDPHHPLTHHGNDPDKVARMAKINAFHVSLFASFLETLQATPEGDGTLLDHSLYLYGSGMGDPNVHDHVNLPILVAGGGAGVTAGRPPRPLRGADAAGQPPPDAARTRGRAPRRLRRQQGTDRRVALALSIVVARMRRPGRDRRAIDRLPASLTAHARAGSLLLASGRASAADATLADAAERAAWTQVRTLLTRNVDVNAAQADGMTALHWAAHHDDLDAGGRAAAGRRTRQRRQSLRRDAAVDRLHQRQRGDGGPLPGRGRRCQLPACPVARPR